jgi:hypothetical protein
MNVNPGAALHRGGALVWDKSHDGARDRAAPFLARGFRFVATPRLAKDSPWWVTTLYWPSRTDARDLAPLLLRP